MYSIRVINEKAIYKGMGRIKEIQQEDWLYPLGWGVVGSFKGQGREPCRRLTGCGLGMAAQQVGKLPAMA